MCQAVTPAGGAPAGGPCPHSSPERQTGSDSASAPVLPSDCDQETVLPSDSDPAIPPPGSSSKVIHRHFLHQTALANWGTYRLLVLIRRMQTCHGYKDFGYSSMQHYLTVVCGITGVAAEQGLAAIGSTLAAELYGLDAKAASLPGYLVPRLVREIPGAPGKTVLPAER